MAGNSNLKVCLVVGAVLIFLLGLVLVGSGVLIYANREKIGQGLARLGETMKQRVKDGQQFGETSDQRACLDEALGQDDGKSGLSAVGSDQFFLGCVSTAAKTEGFCDDAPGPTDLLAFAVWPHRACAKIDRMNDSHCLQVMSAKMQVCIQQQVREQRQSEPSAP